MMSCEYLPAIKFKTHIHLIEDQIYLTTINISSITIICQIFFKIFDFFFFTCYF